MLDLEPFSIFCGGPGSGVPGPCPSDRADRTTSNKNDLRAVAKAAADAHRAALVEVAKAEAVASAAHQAADDHKDAEPEDHDSPAWVAWRAEDDSLDAVAAGADTAADAAAERANQTETDKDTTAEAATAARHAEEVVVPWQGRQSDRDVRRAMLDTLASDESTAGFTALDTRLDRSEKFLRESKAEKFAISTYAHQVASDTAALASRATGALTAVATRQVATIEAAGGNAAKVKAVADKGAAKVAAAGPPLKAAAAKFITGSTGKYQEARAKAEKLKASAAEAESAASSARSLADASDEGHDENASTTLTDAADKAEQFAEDAANKADEAQTQLEVLGESLETKLDDAVDAFRSVYDDVCAALNDAAEKAGQKTGESIDTEEEKDPEPDEPDDVNTFSAPLDGFNVFAGPQSRRGDAETAEERAVMIRESHGEDEHQYSAIGLRHSEERSMFSAPVEELWTVFCGGPGSGKPGPCPDPAKEEKTPAKSPLGALREAMASAEAALPEKGDKAAYDRVMDTVLDAGESAKTGIAAVGQGLVDFAKENMRRDVSDNADLLARVEPYVQDYEDGVNALIGGLNDAVDAMTGAFDDVAHDHLTSDEENEDFADALESSKDDLENLRSEFTDAVMQLGDDLHSNLNDQIDEQNAEWENDASAAASELNDTDHYGDEDSPTGYNEEDRADDANIANQALAESGNPYRLTLAEDGEYEYSVPDEEEKDADKQAFSADLEEPFSIFCGGPGSGVPGPCPENKPEQLSSHEERQAARDAKTVSLSLIDTPEMQIGNTKGDDSLGRLRAFVDNESDGERLGDPRVRAQHAADLDRFAGKTSALFAAIAGRQIAALTAGGVDTSSVKSLLDKGAAAIGKASDRAKKQLPKFQVASVAALAARSKMDAAETAMQAHEEIAVPEDAPEDEQTAWETERDSLEAKWTAAVDESSAADEAEQVDRGKLDLAMDAIDETYAFWGEKVNEESASLAEDASSNLDEENQADPEPEGHDEPDDEDHMNHAATIDEPFSVFCGGPGSGVPGPCPKGVDKAHIVARAHANAAAHAARKAAAHAVKPASKAKVASVAKPTASAAPSHSNPKVAAAIDAVKGHVAGLSHEERQAFAQALGLHGPAPKAAKAAPKPRVAKTPEPLKPLHPVAAEVMDVHRRAIDPDMTVKKINTAVDGLKALLPHEVANLARHMGFARTFSKTEGIKAIRQKVIGRKGAWDRPLA